MIRVLCTDISGIDGAGYQRLYEKASLVRREKADRYRMQEDKIRCITADALLRYVLGADCDSVMYGESGKPCIPERPALQFNLSHSGNWVVLAFGSTPVGVDVEHIRPGFQIRKLAERFFAPEEQQYLLSDPEQTEKRFYEVWTAKESYIKYLGTGLRTDLTSFSVLSLEQQLFCRWLDKDHCLSLCTEEADWSLEYRTVNEL